MFKTVEKKGFQPLQEAAIGWDSLAKQAQLGPAHSLDWLAALCKVQNLDRKLSTKIATLDEQVVGLAPFVILPERWNGIPLRSLTPLTALNQLHGTQFVVEPNHIDGAVGAILESVAAGPNWDMWVMYMRAGEPQALALESHLSRLGYFFVKNQAVASPYLQLPPTWQELQAGLQSRFRTTLRSRERAAREKAKVELRYYKSAAEMTEGLALIEKIESNSWKSRTGLPITHSKHWQFYRTLALKEESTINPLIAVLFLDEQPAAFDYAVQEGGTYYLLQTSYQEELQALYPGLILRKLIIEHLIDQKFTEIDFGTGNTEWKSKWTSTIRDHDTYLILGKTVRAKAVRLAMYLKQRLLKRKS